MPDLVPIRRALISVSDKRDLVPFARRLAGAGVVLISTGGTAKTLMEAGLAVVGIEQVTGLPEMMDGRVKTLHPKVHGGILALRDNPMHAAQMKEHGIEPIDLVVVNLYPFEKTVAQEGVSWDHAIENIDIGGPSMVRSAAKNHAHVVVVTDPAQYDAVAAQMDGHGGATTLEFRRQLAGAAFARTAAYDTAIAQWMARSAGEVLPETLLWRLTRTGELRYGENPHQAGALYLDPRSSEPSAGRARQLHGKSLSFNNLYDADGALELVKEFSSSQIAAAAVIKHANPCGFGLAPTVAEAFGKAYEGDPLAAFGGIVALNRPVDLEAAKLIAHGQKFLEVLLAPDYDPPALLLLQERFPNLRILATGPLPQPDRRQAGAPDVKCVTGGLLVQERDLAPFQPETWQHVAGPVPSQEALAQMRLAMILAKHIKSNAISLVRDSMLVGAGAGQMDRLSSCRIALQKAGPRAQGATAGSDAFFPFRDGPDSLIKAGVKGIVQPGGSKRDDETMAACNEAGVSLLFTGRRHFRH